MLTLTMLCGRYVDGAADGAWLVPTTKSDTENFSISTGPGPGPGLLTRGVRRGGQEKKEEEKTQKTHSIQSRNILGLDLIHV